MFPYRENTVPLIRFIFGSAVRLWFIARRATLVISSCLVWWGVGSTFASHEQGKPVPPGHQPYENARSVLNWPQAEVVNQYPELKETEFAQSQEELPLLLERAGRGVEALFSDFPNTASTEQITQDVSRPPVFSPSIKSRCNYLVVAKLSEKMINLDEFRTNDKGEPIDLSDFYLLTSGFASMPLFFHPFYQSNSAFRYIGRQSHGRRLYVVAFAQKPEATGLIGHFHDMGLPAVILCQGIAWIDPDTYRILKMRTDLLAPRHDILLERQTSEIELGEVSLEGAPHPLWLPSKVVVTIDYQHTTYRNQHHYRDYKLFSVETREGKKEIVPKL